MKTFSINNRCIGCTACMRVAMDHFEVVAKRARLKGQPRSPADEELCFEALDACPASAIMTT